MANFEALIRGALAKQQASDPVVREKIYQSSRNALQRLITENRSMTVEAAVQQQAELEEVISRIEISYLAPTHSAAQEAVPVSEPLESEAPLAELQRILGQPAAPRAEVPDVDQHSARTETVSAPPQPIQTTPSSTIEPVRQMPPVTQPVSAQSSPELQPESSAVVSSNVQETSQLQTSTIGQVEPQIDPVFVEDRKHANSPELYLDDSDSPPPLQSLDQDPPIAFQRRRQTQKRLFWITTTLVILALVGWIIYRVFIGILDGTLLESSQTNQQSTLSSQNNAGEYITILEASDLSALQVAGRGTAEIVNVQNVQMIRISSVRNSADRQQPAEPILLKLKPGVVEQIAGKDVTVEIYAKSGTSGPVQFAIECQFGNDNGCDRKRFRLGLQPEASVFAIRKNAITSTSDDLYLAINTDITNNAAITGEGDVLDISYIRVRPN